MEVSVIEIKKGDTIEIELESFAYGGEAVGRTEQGIVVFVPGGIPGERAKVEITEKKKNYLRGKLLKVIEKSAHRTEAGCGVYGDCGGCHLQHMEYERQLAHKREAVIDTLERIGDFSSPPVAETLGMDYPWQYRNKAQFPLVADEEGRLCSGFYRQGTHEIVINENCPIQHPLVNRTAEKALEVLNEYDLSAYDEEHHRGLLRHLFVRAGVCTNQALLVIVTRKHDFPAAEGIATRIMDRVPELVGVLQNINRERTNVILGPETKVLAGEDRYTDYIGELKFRISPHSFFQVNTLQAEKLYRTVADYAGLTGKERVIDAYAGIGAIALYLAGRAEKVSGLEVVDDAIIDARENARLNGIENCSFYRGKLEKLLAEESAIPAADVLVVDPPRKGMSEEAVEAVLRREPEKIIYVSCNPSTLARDLKLFAAKYSLDAVQPVDMFPQTYHVESVSRLLLRPER
ncbi:MAG: 23S rRNA (uracil(1939)-C(5))-methyltransferase RlmD [Bacillota bacterium]